VVRGVKDGFGWSRCNKRLCGSCGVRRGTSTRLVGRLSWSVSVTDYLWQVLPESERGSSRSNWYPFLPPRIRICANTTATSRSLYSCISSAARPFPSKQGPNSDRLAHRHIASAEMPFVHRWKELISASRITPSTTRSGPPRICP